MSSFRKAIVFSLCVAMLITAGLTGCKKETTKTGTGTHLNLTGYLLGDAPTGMPAVLKALNSKFEKDINADLTINYLGWGEYKTKYPLLFAAGQNVDWVFTGNWCFFNQEPQKGAFAALTLDDIKTYMPKHYAAAKALGDSTFDEIWKEATYNGKIYMIPSTTPDKKCPIFVWRKDLTDKWGIDTSSVARLSDLQKDGYFDSIVKNQPGMTPMVVDNTKDIGNPWTGVMQDNTDHGWWPLTGVGTYPTIYEDWENPGKIVRLSDSDIQSDFINASKIICDWAGKGYINKDALANTTNSTDEFMAGKSGVAFMNTVDLTAQLATATKNGYKLGYAPLVDSKGHYASDPFINNGVAISAFTSKAAQQRSMMMLDLLMQDPVYNQIAYFGIEGTNFKVDNNKIVELDSTYTPDASGFWFTNKGQLKDQAVWSDEYLKLRDTCKTKINIVDPLAAFMADTSDATITSELGNLDTVFTTDMYPIYIGRNSDVPGAFSKLSSDLKKAGIDDVYTKISAQITKYLGTK